MQHFISSGVSGQAFVIYDPPSRVHDAVGTQTPITPLAPVQGPLRVKRGAMSACADIEERTTVARIWVRMVEARRKGPNEWLR